MPKIIFVEFVVIHSKTVLKVMYVTLVELVGILCILKYTCVVGRSVFLLPSAKGGPITESYGTAQ